MNDQRPTRWPCSADSSRKAGPEPRSFRKALTGVSQSSMNVSQTGTRLWVVSATPGKQDLLGVCEAEPARAQQHGQVVEHVGGLLGHPLGALVARGARHLLGLLPDLLAHAPRIGEQLRRIRALGALGRAGGDRALEAWERLVRHRLELAVVEAGALAGVARRAGGLDEREHRVEVAVEAQGLHPLRVARRGALVPQLVARAAVEVQLAGLARALQRLGIEVGERQHLARRPILNHAGREAALVEGN